MKINLTKLEQQFITISSSAQSIDAMYMDLASAEAMSGSQPGFAYAVLALAERIRDANRAAEAELREIMEFCDEGYETIDLEVSVQNGKLS